MFRFGKFARAAAAAAALAAVFGFAASAPAMAASEKPAVACSSTVVKSCWQAGAGWVNAGGVLVAGHGPRARFGFAHGYNLGYAAYGYGYGYGSFGSSYLYPYSTLSGPTYAVGGVTYVQELNPDYVMGVSAYGVPQYVYVAESTGLAYGGLFTAAGPALYHFHHHHLF